MTDEIGAQTSGWPLQQSVNRNADQRPHAVEIGAIGDRSPVAGAANEPGARQDGEVGRQGVVGAVDGLGDRAGGQSFGRMADQQAEDRKARRLAERGEGSERVRRRQVVAGRGRADVSDHRQLGNGSAPLHGLVP